MGDSLKVTFDSYLASSTASLGDVATPGGAPPPVQAAALYVERGGLDIQSPATTTTPLIRRHGWRAQCLQGHMLEYESLSGHRGTLPSVQCDVCQRTIEVKEDRWSCVPCNYDICRICAAMPAAHINAASPATGIGSFSPAASTTPPFPSTIPCRLCPACIDPKFPSIKRQRLPHGCGFSCKVWQPSHEKPWCSYCEPPSKAAVGKCRLRRGLPVSSNEAGGSSCAGHAANTLDVPTTPSLGASTPTSLPTSEPAAPAPPPRPKQLKDLPELAYERLVDGDAGVLLVVCTVIAPCITSPMVGVSSTRH